MVFTVKRISKQVFLKQGHFKFLLLTILTTMLIGKLALAANNQQTTNADVVEILHWMPSENLCGGYFEAPQLLIDYPNPPPMALLPHEISASGPTTFMQDGTTVLEKEVVFTEPGKIATANKAIIYRNGETGRVTLVHLEGDVHLEEKGTLLVGPVGTMNLVDHTTQFGGPSVYHLLESREKFHFKHSYDAWGGTSEAKRDPLGIMDLWNATYTTCAPEKHPSWQISAKHLRLDKKEGVGTAYSSVLRFKGVPVAYIPYYEFPIDNRRKSGILQPYVGYSSRTGADIRIPYYWNMAPNYDMTITPRYMSTRGVQINDLFRYLTHKAAGEVYISFIPADQGFKKYREETLENPPDEGGANLTPYLNELQEDSDNRGYFSVTNTSILTNDWSSHLNINYVTDAYYFKDLNTLYGNTNADQLLNQGDVEYTGDHWNFIALLQAYQTLHLIDNASADVQNQYQRLPEFDADGRYTDLWGGMNWGVNAQSVNFAYSSEFFPVTNTKPIGERVHVLTHVNRPFEWAAGYITPQLAIDDTTYFAENAIPDNETSRPSVDASRNLPIFDIDSGMYFERPWHVGNGVIQTLEPRLFYLYVPFADQNQYPVFDTQLLAFTYEQLFDLNRFSSYDRLENANQLSFGLSSHFLDEQTSNEIFEGNLGIAYYIQPPKVCLNPDNCQSSTFDFIPPDENLSPLVGELIYHPLPFWSVTGNYAWDSIQDKTQNGQIDISYARDARHIVRSGYQFVEDMSGQFPDNTDSLGLSTNTNLVYSGIAWPVTMKLSGIGYAYYNISKERPENYYGGFQYDSCCWALRTVVQRVWLTTHGTDPDNVVNKFDTVYMVQLELKTLGNVGTGKAESLIRSTLPGFQDPFIR